MFLGATNEPLHVPLGYPLPKLLTRPCCLLNFSSNSKSNTDVTFIERLLTSRHRDKPFIYINSCHHNLLRHVLSSQITDGKTEGLLGACCG